MFPRWPRVFRSLELRKRHFADFEASFRSEAAGFGILPDQMDRRIDEILGLLFARLAQVGVGLSIQPNSNTALTDLADPIRLLSDPSQQKRLDVIAEFRGLETEGRPTQPRPMVDSIAKATIASPLVVVVGDGGSGKSVAISDVAQLCCRDRELAPGFAYLTKASSVNRISSHG